MPDEFMTVARTDEVGDHQLLRVELDEQPVILTRVDGRLCALGGICTHEDAELVDGEVDEETVWCPLHASGFNVFTGEVTSPPAEEPLPVYDVREVDGAVQVSRRPRA
ncbi:MAG TPA: Rieske 2Fe-2S domain-containing protein [Chloroflexota bacterium]